MQKTQDVSPGQIFFGRCSGDNKAAYSPGTGSAANALERRHFAPSPFHLNTGAAISVCIAFDATSSSYVAGSGDAENKGTPHHPVANEIDDAHDEAENDGEKSGDDVQNENSFALWDSTKIWSVFMFSGSCKVTRQHFDFVRRLATGIKKRVSAAACLSGSDPIPSSTLRQRFSVPDYKTI